MKKLVSIMVVLVLLISFAVSTVSAKADQHAKLSFRNRTNQVVQLSLTDPVGNIQFFELPEGNFSINVPVGKYTYYAKLPCGNLSGQLNADGAKTYHFGCKFNSPSFSKMVKSCPDQGFFFHESYPEFDVDVIHFFSETNYNGIGWDDRIYAPTYAEGLAEMDLWVIELESLGEIITFWEACITSSDYGFYATAVPYVHQIPP